MADLPRFLTLADVAEILNTSIAQVYALVRRGDLAGDQDRRPRPVAGRARTSSRAYIARMKPPPGSSSTTTRSSPQTSTPDEVTAQPPASSRAGSRAAPKLLADLEKTQLDRLTRYPTSESRVMSRSVLVAVPQHGEGQRLAGLVGADRDDQRDAVGDPFCPSTGDDDVALLEAGVVRRACRR